MNELGALSLLFTEEDLERAVDDGDEECEVLAVSKLLRGEVDFVLAFSTSALAFGGISSGLGTYLPGPGFVFLFGLGGVGVGKNGNGLTTGSFTSRSLVCCTARSLAARSLAESREGTLETALGIGKKERVDDGGTTDANVLTDHRDWSGRPEESRYMLSALSLRSSLLS